jgi:hypothetical protein
MFFVGVPDVGWMLHVQLESDWRTKNTPHQLRPRRFCSVLPTKTTVIARPPCDFLCIDPGGVFNDEISWHQLRKELKTQLLKRELNIANAKTMIEGIQGLVTQNGPIF